MKLKLKTIAKVLGLVGASSAFLVACGGGGSSSGDDSVATFDFVNTANNDVFTTSSFTINTKNATNITANYGTVTANVAASAEDTSESWTYTFDTNKLSNHEITFPIKETFEITDINGATTTKTVDLSPKDELMQYQWHLYNNGKVHEVLRGETTLKGFDLNIFGAWQQLDKNNEPITGKNVHVAVVDDPVDILHADIKDNIFTPTFSGGLDLSMVNSGLSYEDFQKNRSAHGMAVSGIIAASGENFGVRGEAFDAKVYSVPFSVYDAKLIQKDFQYLPYILANEQTDLINGSFGISFYVVLADDDYIYLDELYKKNIPFIKAAGNDYAINFDTLRKKFGVTNVTSIKCTEYNVDCSSNQTDSINTYHASIIVGAVNAKGIKASYSSTGDFLWVAGFGGEYGTGRYGDSAAIASTQTHYDCSELPTVDILGNAMDPVPFDDDDSIWRTSIDKTCNYTARMNGTSAATPSVSGVVSLIKQVNKDFTIPQIKYILAKTARNDLTFPSLAYDSKIIDSIVVYKGWTANNAGNRYSGMYGFGVVDASEAVRLAKNCDNDSSCALRKNLPLDIVSTSTPNCELTDRTNGDYECTFSDLKIQDEEGTLSDLNSSIEIETAQVNIHGLSMGSNEDIDANCKISEDSTTEEWINFLYYADTNYSVTLDSPNDTSSIMKSYLSYLAYDNDKLLIGTDINKQTYLVSNMFYQEKVNASGTWKLHIKSKCAIDTDKLNETMNLRLKGYKI